MTTLIVEDEAGVRELVRDQLQDQGIDVSVASTVATANDAVDRHDFDVVILDLTLPDGSGLEVLDRLRAAESTAHVIILSGSASETDRIRALQRGADDYVVKPFYVRELTARVLAVRRRRNPKDDARLQVGPYVIDLQSRQVVADGPPVPLTAKEFDLFAYLAARPGHVFSREQLLESVWHSASDWQQEATVTEHIRRLRLKLEADPARPQLIRTVRGVGYRVDLVTDRPDGGQEPAHRPVAIPTGAIIHVDGRIVFADNKAVTLLGYRNDADLRGRQLIDLVAPASKDAAQARMEAGETGQVRRSELMDLLRADGDVVSVEVGSSTVDWHGERAERVRLTHIPDAPSRLRRLMTGVLSEVTEAIIITDLHFHVRSWNAAAERLYGWRIEDALGRHLLDLVRWVGDSGELAAAWASLERKGRWNGEGQQATHDGSSVHVLTSMTLLRDDTGVPIGVISVNRLAGEPGPAAAGEPEAQAATPTPAAIAAAIANDEFEVYYLPVVGFDDQRIVTLEALVRWNHPALGVLTPAEFLDTAEHTGLIVELGSSVLEKACRQTAAWRSDGADIELAVNLSTRQLADPALVELFEHVLAASGLDPAALWLEVTETAVVEEVEGVSEVLRRLVGLGVRVAIDDFGTGWASLTYLRTFPVHALKIDSTFVAGVGINPADTAIVRSILSLGADLGLLVVAEGIETEVQQDTLRDLGCSFGQGFLFGRPIRADEVAIHRAPRLLNSRPTEFERAEPAAD